MAADEGCVGKDGRKLRSEPSVAADAAHTDPVHGAGAVAYAGGGMLTAKGKYGLKAMVHLAGAEPQLMVPIGEIAGHNGIPRKFLDAILGELRHAGLLYSRKGPGGGYALARSAREITLGEIVRALDGPLAPISCASRTAYRACDDCADIAHCPVRLLMLQVRNAMSDVLDRRTLAELRSMASDEQEVTVYRV